MKLFIIPSYVFLYENLRKLFLNDNFIYTLPEDIQFI